MMSAYVELAYRRRQSWNAELLQVTATAQSDTRAVNKLLAKLNREGS